MAKVLISLPDNFITGVDRVCEDLVMSRSELIRAALRKYVKEEGYSNIFLKSDIIKE